MTTALTVTTGEYLIGNNCYRKLLSKLEETVDVGTPPDITDTEYLKTRSERLIKFT